LIVGYYILPIDVFHAAAKEDPFHACAHQIDDTHVICWARFLDHGHEQRFLAREGVEALPDARRDRAIAKHHAKRLERYGVKDGHSTLDVSDRLIEVAGHCMKLPHF
jgi:hypothetical protein